jgi:hypothetical protein
MSEARADDRDDRGRRGVRPPAVAEREPIDSPLVAFGSGPVNV